MVLGFLTVENFDFTRKIVKNSCKSIFGQKFDFSNSVIDTKIDLSLLKEGFKKVILTFFDTKNNFLLVVVVHDTVVVVAVVVGIAGYSSRYNSIDHSNADP